MIRVLSMLSLLVFMVACNGLLGGRAARAKQLADATIFLLPTGDASAPCAIRTTPQLLEVEKKEHVVWTIVDACRGTSANDVEVVFSSTRDPLDGTCTRRSRDRIRCAIKDGAAEGVYKYTVRLGERSEDPELEIIQF